MGILSIGGKNLGRWCWRGLFARIAFLCLRMGCRLDATGETWLGRRGILLIRGMIRRFGFLCLLLRLGSNIHLNLGPLRMFIRGCRTNDRKMLFLLTLFSLRLPKLFWYRSKFLSISSSHQ